MAESNQTPPVGPSLCTRCFEFYGSEATASLCSSCYKAHVSEQQATAAAAPAVAAVAEAAAAKPAEEAPAAAAAVPPPAAEPAAPAGAAAAAAEEEPAGPSTTTAAAAEGDAPDSAPPARVQPPGRCAECRKKVGLASGFTCRCGFSFCSSHRLAEDHKCTFDYRTTGRAALAAANPQVVASKIQKL